jgi:hypothetical protein
MRDEPAPRRTERVIYRPFITVKGRKIWARQYGLKAFRLVVKD